MSGRAGIGPFTLRFDRRWPTGAGITTDTWKWYVVYRDGEEYGRLCVWKHGGAYLCGSDGARIEGAQDRSTQRDFACIRECLHGSIENEFAMQEALF